MYFTPTNALIDFYYPNDPEMAELLKDVKSNPQDRNASFKLQELRKQREFEEMEKIKQNH